SSLKEISRESTWRMAFSVVAPRLYVLADVQLIESGPGLVKPGENLRLTCSVTFSRAYAKLDDYAWSWIRQPPGKGLEWLGTTAVNILSEDRERVALYAPSLQDRMTISVDSSQKQLYLQLSSLTAADTAVYYCAGEPQ
uniref:Ig-like domain-containing protein n=1 Tax=Varanus komodoensis TaxID=61221 RepID=A0A8D2L2R6_VARKO